MIKETILCFMITLDWLSHIAQATTPNDFLFKQWASLVHSLGYDAFWITYWGVGVLLSSLILIDKMEGKVKRK